MADLVRRQSGLWLWSFLLAATLAWILPELLRDDFYDGDAAHHVYWAYKYADPALFPSDFASEYFAHPSIVPRGYDALYRLMAPVYDIQVASEILGALLFGLSLFLAYRLGVRAGGDYPRLSGFAAMFVVTVAIEQLYLLPPMGLQRAFALPLTLTAVLALHDSRLWLLGLVFLAAALFYPIVCATLGVCSMLYLGPNLVRERRLPKGWLPLVVLGSAALAIIATAGSPEGAGPMVTLSQALQMPEFGPEGRQSLFGSGGFRNLFAHHRTGMGFPPKWVVLMIAVVGFLAWRRRLGAVPAVAWALLGAGLLVWAIARLTMFTLYLPQRHTWWSLPVGFAMLVATAVPAVAQVVGPRLLRGGVFAAGMVVLATYGWSSIQQLRIPRDHDLDAAYAYLRTLPPETLVAAHPMDADDVPMRARRSVLVSRETSISFMLGYYNRAKERLAAALAATYATDWCAVDVLGSRFGVDVFLVSPLPWRVDTYDEPFASEVTALIERGRRDGFVLRDPPRERILFRSGDVYVVRVDECAPSP